MKLDLDKYNKRLLAIIGTTAVVLALGGMLIGIIAFAVDQISRANRRDHSDVITVEQSTDSTTMDNQPVVRKYEITMDNMVLIDSASATYIVPVGHVKLENEELINGEITNFGSGSSESYRSKKFSYQRGSGFFNNMIIYKGKEQVSQVVFKTKTVITSYFTVQPNGELIVIFQAVGKDSNGDKSLTASDFNVLFIYHVASQKMEQVKVEGASVNHSYYLPDLNSLMITCIKDKNNNGETEYREPKVLYTYDLDQQKLTPIVSDKNTAAMQKMLDK